MGSVDGDGPVPLPFRLPPRFAGPPKHAGPGPRGASDVWTHMRARLSGVPVEEFWAIAVDVRHRVVLDSLLARGSLTALRSTRATCSAP